jgi:hypothetical protein
MRNYTNIGKDLIVEGFRAYMQLGSQRAAAKQVGIHRLTLRYNISRIRAGKQGEYFFGPELTYWIKEFWKYDNRHERNFGN